MEDVDSLTDKNVLYLYGTRSFSSALRKARLGVLYDYKFHVNVPYV
jgi:hypothetical protein